MYAAPRSPAPRPGPGGAPEDADSTAAQLHTPVLPGSRLGQAFNHAGADLRELAANMEHTGIEVHVGSAQAAAPAASEACEGHQLEQRPEAVTGREVEEGTQLADLPGAHSRRMQGGEVHIGGGVVGDQPPPLRRRQRAPQRVACTRRMVVAPLPARRRSRSSESTWLGRRSPKRRRPNRGTR